jgi:CHAT domain-containing protein
VFYDRLAAGAGAATALREAKLALRGNPATAHPFFWAGFTLLSTE